MESVAKIIERIWHKVIPLVPKCKYHCNSYGKKYKCCCHYYASL